MHLVVVQGLGGGCIYAMTQIVTSDLVPLSERAAYQSALVMVYALAAGIGPFVVSPLPCQSVTQANRSA